ncbi:MAG TPA: SLC13 family permease [Longimicrobiales bacterium]|nr:SLC13 family permease [Longimicrobiales bacterium]
MIETAPAFTVDVLLTIAVTLGALGLFLWNRLRVDVVGIIVMVTLILVGLVTPREGISGFANEAVITVAAMFVLSSGLLRTGAIDILSQWTERTAGRGEFRLLVVTLALVVPLSAFINNTPVVVVVIPMVLGLSRKLNVAPSRLFMPISFGSQLGGTLTLIGTSTNLLVAGLVLDLGLERIRLFDITLPALIIAAVGIAYLLTVGRWLTPLRAAEADLISSYDLRDFLTGLIITGESPVVGKSLRESNFATRYGLNVIGIERGGQRIPFPRGGTILAANDILIVEGKVAEIARVEEEGHFRIAGTRPDFPLTERRAEGQDRPTGNTEGRAGLAELIVPPRSPVIGRSIRQLNFRNRFGLPVLGIQRRGMPHTHRMRDVVLEPGDILLVNGSARELRQVHSSGELALLGTVDVPARRRRKLKYSVPIIIAVVILAAFEIVPILVSALLGVTAMFVTGCITPDEAYKDMDWMVIVLLGSIIPLGIAMQNTGTALLLATQLLNVISPLGLFGILAAFYLLTSLLTELISNNAAAVVMTPIAVAVGSSLGVSPMPFIIAVMFAASNSFMTPIGYQTNTFIYGPGGYKFSDFVRVGGPLNLLLLIVATFVIPIFFPF